MEEILRADDLVFRYGDRPVLDGLSAVFEEGIFYGILGPNGCGKSTFMDLLSGHWKPTSGTVRYRGNELQGYQRAALAREMALVPQDYAIRFPFTAEEGVVSAVAPEEIVVVTPIDEISASPPEQAVVS